MTRTSIRHGAVSSRPDAKACGAFMATVAALSVACGACGGSAPDARYPERKAGCAVKKYAAQPDIPVDEVGVVTVDCVPGATSCERQVLDAVCARGGDVAFGLGDNALSANRIVAHAAHSKRAIEGARERGCAVQVFTDAPAMATENVGTVTAYCAEDDAKEVCIRELEDQVCLLGGNVVWQVEGPTMIGDKRRTRGQAAHTR